MPLGRNEITIAKGTANEVTLEVRPFNWPRSVFEVLEVQGNDKTGWAKADSAAIAKLRAQYNGAHGQIIRGLKGLIVQYAEGTGSAQFQVEDWRGNLKNFVFAPDDGLVIEEIHGSASENAPLGSAFHTLTIRLVLMDPAP